MIEAQDEAYESLDMEIGEEADEGGWTLLPDGIYSFVVTKVEQERYEPGPNSKLPACWRVTVGFAVDDGKGTSGYLSDNLFCTKKQSWKIKRLFVAAGLVAPDAPKFTPDWKALVNSAGVMEVSVRKYRDRDNNERETNDVKAYLSPTEGAEALAKAMGAAQPSQQQPAQQAAFSFPGAAR